MPGRRDPRHFSVRASVLRSPARKNVSSELCSSRGMMRRCTAKPDAPNRQVAQPRESTAFPSAMGRSRPRAPRPHHGYARKVPTSLKTGVPTVTASKAVMGTFPVVQTRREPRSCRSSSHFVAAGVGRCPPDAGREARLATPRRPHACCREIRRGPGPQAARRTRRLLTLSRLAFRAEAAGLGDHSIQLLVVAR